jgi:hypothetical protein
MVEHPARRSSTRRAASRLSPRIRGSPSTSTTDRSTSPRTVSKALSGLVDPPFAGGQRGRQLGDLGSGALDAGRISARQRAPHGAGRSGASVAG